MLDNESLEERMTRIRLQNEQLLKRHMEVQADKMKAAREKALVDPHAKIDEDSMTPAERNATFQQRSRLFDGPSRDHEPTNSRKYSSRSSESEPRFQEHNGKFGKLEHNNSQRPKLVSSSRKELVRWLTESNDDDMFKNVESLDDFKQESGSEYVGPFRSPPELEKNPSNTDSLELSLEHGLNQVGFHIYNGKHETAQREPSPPLQFDPDMDFSVPPPPIMRSKVYGSGRLSKSRLSKASNLPDLLLNDVQSSGNYPSNEPEVFSPPFEPDVFSPLSYPSLHQLAEALNNCQTDSEQYQQQLNHQNQNGYQEPLNHQNRNQDQEPHSNQNPDQFRIQLNNQGPDQFRVECDSQNSDQFHGQLNDHNSDQFRVQCDSQNSDQFHGQLNDHNSDQFPLSLNSSETSSNDQIFGNGVWSEIGNFQGPSLAQGQPQPGVCEDLRRQKSALQYRLDAVRRETCKRFSRAQYMSQEPSGKVEISFVKNTPDNNYQKWCDPSLDE